MGLAGMDLVDELTQLRHELEQLLKGCGLLAEARLLQATVVAAGAAAVGDLGRVVVVACCRGGEEAVALGQPVSAAEMDLFRAPRAVLGVTDPRWLTWWLEERLRTEDDLSTGCEHHKDPLQASCEDDYPGQLPRQVVRPLQTKLAKGRSTGIRLTSTALLGPCRRLGLGRGRTAAAACTNTATVNSHVLHLVHQAMLSILELFGRGDEP
mmetsp:Transcript_20558/g.51375  ORF Transcript_20558/g.51375 Transcript_20558/m.51375 type:complete len:210 (+) Transcript_20558:908-1537(+)